MTRRGQLETLIARIEARGATCLVRRYGESRVKRVTIHSARGIGPHGVAPLRAAGRIRVWLAV